MTLKKLSITGLSLSILAASLNLGSVYVLASSDSITTDTSNTGSGSSNTNPEKLSTLQNSERSRINIENTMNPSGGISINSASVHQVGIKSTTLQSQSTPQLDQSIILKGGIKATTENIDLTVNKAQLINLKAPISRVSISQSGIASVTMINPNQIQLLGKRVGVANLLIWPANSPNAYTSVDIVVHRDVSALSRQLHAIDPGLNVVPMAAEDTVILTGSVSTIEASQLAVQLAKAFFNKSQESVQTAGSNTMQGNQNNQMPGSALPTESTNVINLIQVAGQPSTKLAMAREKLQQIDANIKLDIIPGPNNIEKAVLTGTVQNPAQISEAVNTASVFYGQLGMKVIAGPGGNSIRPTGGANFQNNENFSDNSDINLLQGSVVTDATGNVVSMLKLARKPQVKCTIRFLDISRRDVNQLGATLTGLNGNLGYGSFSGAQSSYRSFSDIAKATIGGNNSASGWLNATSAKPLAASALAQSFGTGTTQILTLNRNMTVALSAFVETHKVKTLAEPTLLMLSGEKASFLAGGEIPIPVTGTNGQISVTYKQFGIRLNIIPTVTEDNKINLQVAPEVSAVDPSNTIVANNISIPGIRTRRMQTTLEVQPNQSLVLAGLFNQEEADVASRFPMLGDLPVIGAFFRQKNRDKLSNEMMVVITPQVFYDDGPSASPSVSPEGKQLFENSSHRKTTSYNP